MSWWSWQETNTAEWQALSAPLTLASSASRPARSYPLLRSRSRGDLVVLVQQLLRAAVRKVPVTGVMDRKTLKALRKFQRKRKLRPKGKVNAPTWIKLLARRAEARQLGRARERRERSRAERPALGEPPGEGLRDPAVGGGRLISFLGRARC